jgi:hypothetical protein
MNFLLSLLRRVIEDVVKPLTMKHLSSVLLLVSFYAFGGNPYPRTPDAELTPGALCETPSRLRYPEQIAYCERDVNSFTKEVVFIAYRDLGYSLSGPRERYKVDHFIPLCAGGSNDIKNLWPQYDTISRVTDPLEPLACEVLALGKITQVEVIEIIKEAKLDTKQVPRLMQKLRSLKR